MKAYFVRAEFGKHTEVFLKNGFVAIGWFDEPAENYNDWESIKARYREYFPSHSSGTTGQNVGQIYRFWNEIKDQDIVVTTFNDGDLLIGIADGKPYFKNDIICPFFDRINVKWIDKRFKRKELSIPTQNTIRSSLTVFNISQVNEIAIFAGVKTLNDNLPGPNVNNISVDAKLIYEAIRIHLLELSDLEFENFVSYILQSLGFITLQRTGKVADGGVDYQGILDVQGVASVKLMVQVKRYKDANVKETDIRNFRGTYKRDHMLTFITLSNFDKKAKVSAESTEHIPINLINGEKLIQIFIEQYDKVIQLIEDEGNADLLNKLKFKKVIIPN